MAFYRTHFCRHITILLGCLFIMTSTSGCALFGAYKDWAYRMGEKMPTHNSAKRCPDGKWFCFGEDDYKEKPKTAGRPMNIPPPPPGGMPPPPGMPPYGQPAPYGQPPQPYGTPPSPYAGQGMPQHDQYGGRIPRVAPPSGGDLPPGYAPPGSPPPFAPQGDLQPWEANPDWKQDLPPSPFERLMNDLDW